MNWILTALLCVILVELGLRLPLSNSLHGLSRAGTRALHVVRSPTISDHWKEKVMGAYARTTFGSTLKLAVLLVIFFGAALLLIMLGDRIFPGYQSFVLSWGGIGLTTVLATLYFLTRRAVIRGLL